MQEENPELAETVVSSSLQLAKHAGIHLLAWLVVLSLFGATDSWSLLTGLGLASLLSIVTALIAGITTTTLIHEWFHLLGAWLCGGSYQIPSRAGLFVFDWDFEKNSVNQFHWMSVAGSVGGAVGVFLLWISIPTDSPGRAALVAAGIAGFIFAATIEWPVLWRTRRSGEPLVELSRVNNNVLLRSLLTSVIGGLVAWLLIY